MGQSVHPPNNDLSTATRSTGQDCLCRVPLTSGDSRFTVYYTREFRALAVRNGNGLAGGATTQRARSCSASERGDHQQPVAGTKHRVVRGAILDRMDLAHTSEHLGHAVRRGLRSPSPTQPACRVAGSRAERARDSRRCLRDAVAPARFRVSSPSISMTCEPGPDRTQSTLSTCGHCPGVGCRVLDGEAQE